jgi:formylglycine-generating enzyme required for sulfatase activity
LITQALAADLTPAGLRELKESLRPLLVAANVEPINLEPVKLQKPRLPFEPDTVLIPAGSFLLGSPPGPGIPPEETPRHPLTLPDYRLGRYPVTNAQYAAFLQQQPQHEAPPLKLGWFLREPPAGKADHPVVGVSWFDALAYCRWLSGQTERVYRLPTEAEWEKAAIWAGDAPRVYPWGNNFDPACCNSMEAGLNGASAVGQFSPQGDSPAGCADMAGNVQEWTSTLWGPDLNISAFPYPYRANDGREDLTAHERLHRVYRLYRGGCYRDTLQQVRGAARGWSDPDSKIRWRGFRVVEEL